MDQLTTTVRHQSWTQMIQAQKASGLSIKQWCLENHISENCFFYRQRRLRDCAGEALHQFVEIQQIDDTPYLENSNNDNSVAQIVAGRVVIGLSNNASEELISRIVRVLNAK